jgi:GT2 family glycosyltransferase
MQWIDKCLQSLLNSLYKTEIIVIDNGSVDGTVDHIKQNYTLIKLIQAEKNLGFGQGNNIGLKIALQKKADYVFLLNQDAWVENDTIPKLLTAHGSNPSYGILSPIHLNGMGNDFDNHFYIYLKNSAINKHSIENIKNKKSGDDIISSPFVNAAAWFISLSCLQKTGGFDPIFFHYGEDDNYAQRAVYKGYKIGILPTANIYHDKERPSLTQSASLQKKIWQDWVQFLTHACNINNKGYKIMMLKRSCRHLLQMAGALLAFNTEKITYNFTMAKNILSYFGKVKQSRAVAVTNTLIPHLHQKNVYNNQGVKLILS